VAESGKKSIFDVVQTADEERHITCLSAYRFGGQMLPNTAIYFPIYTYRFLKM
jgi:hypothetical protein